MTDGGLLTESAAANPLVSHGDIAAFAAQSVNLRREDAKEYRDQVNRLRDKLAEFIREHPDYGLIKMLLSGSLAKGTALKSINDIDVAVYVQAGSTPVNERDLLDWLAARLREAYPQMDPEQIKPVTHVVRISFRGTGLDVDVAPVHYDGAADDRGYLVARDTGKRVLTSIPLHLKFIRKRKDSQPEHLAQVVRLIKWWGRERKKQDDAFRLKSFMCELLVAHLADSGAVLSDYPSALEGFFRYVVKSQLRARIAFADHYSASKLPAGTGEAIEIFDPVNESNNVASGYSHQDRQRIVDAAEQALDALSEARFATTRGRAISCWQEVLGQSFRG